MSDTRIPYQPIEEAAKVLREHAGSGASLAMLALLEALDAVYLDELTEAVLPAFAAIQERLRQLRTLKKVVRGDQYATGRL